MSDFEKHSIVAAHLSAHYAGPRQHNDGPMYRSMAIELYEKLKLYEEQEAVAVTDFKDCNGAYVLHVPIQYMQESAKEKDLAIYKLLKEQLRKINNGESEGMILPAITDEMGNRMFTLEYVGPKQ